jgi:predicted acylesterase/phospholipase RssA
VYIHNVPGFGVVPPAAGQTIREYDGVFEGGGAKGVAFVGALAFMKRHGLRFRRVAGTSAGAITAALIASGYPAYDDTSGDETIESITFRTNFLQFLDAPGRSHFTDDEIERSPFYTLLSGLAMQERLACC